MHRQVFPFLLRSIAVAFLMGVPLPITVNSIAVAEDDVTDASETAASLRNSERVGQLQNEALHLFYDGQFKNALRTQDRCLRALKQQAGDAWQIAFQYSMRRTFERFASLNEADQIVARGALRKVSAGLQQLSTGRPARARQLLEQGISAWNSLLDSSDLVLATTWTYCAQCEKKLGKPEEAVAAMEKALTIRGELLGTNSPIYAGTLVEFGGLQTENRDFENAEINLRRALEVMSLTGGEESFEYCCGLFQCSELKLQRGDPEAAEELAARAIQMLVVRVPDAHPVLVKCRWKRARSLADQGDVPESLALYGRIVPMLKFGDAQIEIEVRSEIFHDYADTLRKDGQTEEADEYLAWSRDLSPTANEEQMAGRDKPAASIPSRN